MPHPILPKNENLRLSGQWERLGSWVQSSQGCHPHRAVPHPGSQNREIPPSWPPFYREAFLGLLVPNFQKKRFLKEPWYLNPMAILKLSWRLRHFAFEFYTNSHESIPYEEDTSSVTWFHIICRGRIIFFFLWKLSFLYKWCLYWKGF